MAASAVREIGNSLRSSPGFGAAVLLTLAFAALIGGMVIAMQLQPGFMGMSHGSEPHHRIHDLAYGLLFTTAVVGVAAQLRRPAANVSGMLMALIPWVALGLAAALARDSGVVLSAERILVGSGSIVTALLHPTGDNLFRSLVRSRVNPSMVGLVLLAAIPLLPYAVTNLQLQATVQDEHAAMGHYGFMAAFSFTTIATGFLASLNLEGWRIAAWVAGFLPMAFGVISLMFSDSASSGVGTPWASAAIAWGVAFTMVAESASRRNSADPTATSNSDLQAQGGPPP
jgi:hypothetical protein